MEDIRGGMGESRIKSVERQIMDMYNVKCTWGEGVRRGEGSEEGSRIIV